MKEAMETGKLEAATVAGALRKYRSNVFEDW